MGKTYKIKKGNHYSSGINFGLHINPNLMVKKVKFNKDCVYILNQEDMLDINKLFGFSFGLHHDNSVRFGWRYSLNDNKIELLMYVYRDGERINEWDEDLSICKIDLGVEYTLMIQVTEYEYVLSVFTDKDVYVKKTKKSNNLFPIGYELFPYFGGNNVAPSDMSIFID